MTDTQAIAVTVTAVNDNAPVITSNGGGASVSVNVAENTTAVTTVTATDADLPAQHADLHHRRRRRRGAVHHRRQHRDTDVRQRARLRDRGDADADNVYDVTVQVSDGTQAAVQTLHVTLGNTNEAPTALQVTGGAVLERSPAGTLVATVSVADPDAGDLFTFTLVTDANGRFVIDPASGRLLVSNSASLDFASASQHTLIVQVTDAGGLSHRQDTVVVDVAPIVVLQELPPLTPPSVPWSPTPLVQQDPAPPSGSTPNTAAPPTSHTPPSGGGGATLPPALEMAPSRATTVDDGTDAARGGRSAARAVKLHEDGDNASITLSFALLDPEELQAQALAADESSLQRSVDALLRQSFGLTRGQAVQIDEPPSEPRDQSTTEAILRVVTDPVKVSSVAFTAGFVWWLTRGGGLLATMLMGIPAWRHIDLAPVLARGFDEDDEDDDEFDLLPEATEPSRLDVLSELRMRSMTEAPSFDGVLDDGDGSPAADLFDPVGSRAAASGRR